MARIQTTQVDQDHGFSSCYISEGEDFYIGKSSQRKIDLHQDN